MPRHFQRSLADLHRFVLVKNISQLSEGMTLIDKWGCKRNILMITKTHIWLSHKYGRQSKTTGKEWPIDLFMTNFKNWIFVPRERPYEKR